jgi:hypothetical protein
MGQVHIWKSSAAVHADYAGQPGVAVFPYGGSYSAIVAGRLQWPTIWVLSKVIT